MSKTPSPPEEIVDPYPDPDPPTARPPEDGAEQIWPGWNGRSSKIAVAYPLVRDFVPTGPNEPCLDCKRAGRPSDRSHQFHARCSLDLATGRWSGPEGQHLEDLRAQGMLRNTPEARDRALRQSEIDEQRGTFGTRDNPDGQPSLQERTTAQLKRELHSTMKDGAAGAQLIERGLVRSETAELRDAVRTGMAEGAAPLVEAIKEALAGRSPKPTEEAES